MKFRTEVKIDVKENFFSLKDKTISIGSCFSENIGERLKEDGFDIVVNPFGILFHPQIIAKNIKAVLDNSMDDSGFLFRDERWFHYDFHSKISARSKEELKEKLAITHKNTRMALLKSSKLILTFGTSWGFNRIVNDELVGNCHKIPQKEFVKVLADLEELKKEYTDLLQRLKEENEKLDIVLTVSPVRHIKNGTIGNNISKSILILLCDYLCQKFDFVHYFPSYEIVMDELRDYRFFNSDLLHPTDFAVDFIYEKFESVYFNEKNRKVIKLQRKLNLLQKHRSINEGGEEKNEEKKKQLENEIEALKVKL